MIMNILKRIVYYFNLHNMFLSCNYNKKIHTIGIFFMGKKYFVNTVDMQLYILLNQIIRFGLSRNS